MYWNVHNYTYSICRYICTELWRIACSRGSCKGCSVFPYFSNAKDLGWWNIWFKLRIVVFRTCSWRVKRQPRSISFYHLQLRTFCCCRCRRRRCCCCCCGCGCWLWLLVVVVGCWLLVVVGCCFVMPNIPKSAWRSECPLWRNACYWTDSLHWTICQATGRNRSPFHFTLRWLMYIRLVGPLQPLPSNSGKWRFWLGTPTENVISLVLTTVDGSEILLTSWGW